MCLYSLLSYWSIKKLKYGTNFKQEDLLAFWSYITHTTPTKRTSVNFNSPRGSSYLCGPWLSNTQAHVYKICFLT